jgi:replicative DNA helicase
MTDTLTDERLEAQALSQLTNLATVSLDDAATALDAEPLRPEDFGSRSHGLVFQHAATTIRAGRPPTFEVLHQLLAPQPGYDKAGGANWLRRVLDSSGDVWLGSYRGSAVALRELSKRRGVAQLASRLLDGARSGADLDEAIASAQRGLLQAAIPGARLETFDLHVREFLDDLDAAQSGKHPPCIPTGIAIWDEVIGGLFAEQLHFIGSYPGGGKSALLGRMVWNLSQHMPVGFFSLEDRPKWLARRLVADVTGIAIRKLATLRLRSDEHQRAVEAAGRLYERAPRVFFQGPERRLRPAEAAMLARGMIVNGGARALFLDHMGELDTRSNRRDRHDLDLDEGIQEIRRIATDHRVPFVVAAHLRRRSFDSDGRFEKPTQQSFAETAYIERKARVAVGLWQERGDRGWINTTVLKHTHGESDVTFRLRFDPPSALVLNEGGVVELDSARRPRRGFDERMEARP